MVKDKIRDAVFASFVGDAFSLGVHWIYDTRVIDKRYGRVDELLRPELATFHRGKGRGAFTHYGDQMLVLLESLAETHAFNPLVFSDRWQALMRGGSCYIDTAARETLLNIDAGGPAQALGSSSADLGGAARIAPLLLCHHHHAHGLREASRAQTAMTHNHPGVIAVADLFALTALFTLQGSSPVSALRSALRELDSSSEIEEAVNRGLASTAQETRHTIATFGQACAFEAALPSTVHLISKYEDNLKEALVENAMAGGDSSARGMLTGLILGAHQGLGTIPPPWIHGMVRYGDICRLMDGVLGEGG